MPDRPYVGVGVIIWDGDRVLLMRRQGSHGAGTWSTPGGHLEFGESPEECGAREAEEETGVRVANLAVRTVTNDVFADEGKHYVTIWVEGTLAAGEARINSAREMSEVGWFPWDALPTPRFLPLEHLLAQGFTPQKRG